MENTLESAKPALIATYCSCVAIAFAKLFAIDTHC